MINKHPIGIFDSGIGGLSIAKCIREVLPNEDIIYIADSLYTPYGDKSQAYIKARTFVIVEQLISQGVKAIVVACNTITVSVIQELRAVYKLPIIGVEPGVKPAAFNTRSGVIGVLATTQTLKSTSFNELKAIFSTHVSVEVQACPGWVELVESLELEGDKTKKLITQYVNPLLEKGADNIVLGCTHYAFLEPTIRSVSGPHVTIINTGYAVAKEAVRRLKIDDLLNDQTERGKEIFMSTETQQSVDFQFSRLWGSAVSVSRLPSVNGA